ncbi:MAG: MoaD/ThiS family protein [Deltaproteobacteria bacterium]|jgi:sulfur carrier protein ThiS|nr:MoaD/ThiS family protein [Deltaproteobacteria bacterium]MBT4637192.1 MoaD/ThiS family protein [Deltaproteobacteria bacterium]MBT6500553.1 MoaD/ThiS family protein [Deltaproteobacteria bacterium]
MIVTVKLFGNLKEKVAQTDSENGIQCEVKLGETVAGLLRQLNISDNNEPVVIQNSQVLKKSDVLKNEEEIRIMQPLDGG